MQFFSKKTAAETSHELVEDLVDDEEEEEEEEVQKIPEQDDEDSNNGTISCPVCQKMLLGGNDKINKHIDLCLNGEMVRTTIREEDRRTSPQIQAKKR